MRVPLCFTHRSGKNNNGLLESSQRNHVGRRHRCHGRLQGVEHNILERRRWWSGRHQRGRPGGLRRTGTGSTHIPTSGINTDANTDA